MGIKIEIGCRRGVESLTLEERDVVDKIANQYYEKIMRHVKEISSFEVYIKCHQKQGNSKRYKIEVRVKVPGFVLEADSDEWDLKLAVHKVLTKIVNEIEHKTHLSDEHGAGLRK